MLLTIKRKLQIFLDFSIASGRPICAGEKSRTFFFHSVIYIAIRISHLNLVEMAFNLFINLFYFNNLNNT